MQFLASQAAPYLPIVEQPLGTLNNLQEHEHNLQEAKYNLQEHVMTYLLDLPT